MPHYLALGGLSILSALLASFLIGGVVVIEFSPPRIFKKVFGGTPKLVQYFLRAALPIAIVGGFVYLSYRLLNSAMLTIIP